MDAVRLPATWIGGRDAVAVVEEPEAGARDLGVGRDRAEAELHCAPVVVGVAIADMHHAVVVEKPRIRGDVPVEVGILRIRLDGDGWIELDWKYALGVLEPCGIDCQVDDEIAAGFGHIEGSVPLWFSHRARNDRSIRGARYGEGEDRVVLWRAEKRDTPVRAPTAPCTLLRRPWAAGETDMRRAVGD